MGFFGHDAKALKRGEIGQASVRGLGRSGTTDERSSDDNRRPQSALPGSPWHRAAVDSLVPLVIEMAFSTLQEALPGADAIETRSEFNEDRLATLRIVRVADESGNVISDIADGHPDPAAEEAVDLVGVD